MNREVIIDPQKQDSKEWLEWRQSGLGSSDIALLMMPVHFGKTINDLWKDRVGYEKIPFVDNEHVKRGKLLEPKICKMVNTILGARFKPECVMRKDAPYLRASLDGVDWDLEATLEIKAPADNTFNKQVKDFKVPDSYFYQMQYQLLCTDLPYGYYAFYNVMNKDPYIILVEEDIPLQLEIERRAALLWYAVKNKMPIGWDGADLRLYPTKPLMFLVIASPMEKQTVPYEIAVNNTPEEMDETFVAFVQDYKTIAEFKYSNPDHECIILNNVKSPFSPDVESGSIEKQIERYL